MDEKSAAGAPDPAVTDRSTGPGVRERAAVPAARTVERRAEGHSISPVDIPE